ncbi:hypothetical protein AALO_G00194130, partial [Alosa alosa]
CDVIQLHLYFARGKLTFIIVLYIYINSTQIVPTMNVLHRIRYPLYINIKNMYFLALVSFVPLSRRTHVVDLLLVRFMFLWKLLGPTFK